MIRSRSEVFIPSRVPIRDGRALKNQMWVTGAARLMWPRRLRRTREWVTVTPHRSQMTPLCLIPLYFPQKHSQSRSGPKIFSQKSPSFSARYVR